MSLENAENIRNKLMDILEEELSALNLKEIDKCNVNDTKKTHQNDDEDADNESFSSSSDTTAELLKEVDNSQHEKKYKVTETLNPLNKNIVKEMQPPIKYQNPERDLTHQENAVTEEDKISVKESESKLYGKKTCMTNEENFIPPSDSLAEKIRQRAEFYFEDYNIFKNSYLLSYIRRNKNGYINLRILCSLRKIKSLTRDPRVVAYSLKDSEVLEMNEENRIRRIEPVPKTEDTNFGKTLMVFNLPPQNLSADTLREMFSKFGTVVSAGIYEIDSPASDIYHQRCLYFHRKIASKVYGIVEFEKYDEVVKVLKDEDGHLPKENEVKAVPLLPQIYKKEKRYLKFLKPYHPNTKRGYDRYRPRNDFYREATASGDVMRNEKMSSRGGYNYQRGYFWRPYRGKKSFIPSNTKSFVDDYYPRERNQPSRGMPKKWSENRQLRTNNSLNIDRLYPNTQRKKVGYGYANHGTVA